MSKALKIGIKHKPFIIAEISGNHNGSLTNALKIVRSAAKCGVSAIKLQTYTADTMTINSKKKDFLIKDKNSLWKGYTLYNLYKKAHTPWNWHKAIFNEAKKNGILYFSTPFDHTAVKFLEKFNLPIYKVSSFENTDLRLIKIIAKTKKPLIISLGMANLKEINEAVKTARKNGCKKIILLKCTSDYPAKPEDANLISIEYLKKKFKCEVGLSDHTLGVATSVAAIARGATVIEKHFIYDKKLKGVDSKFSLDFKEMKRLVDESLCAWKSIGKVDFRPSKSERKNLKFRRSIYIVKDMKKGEKFSIENIKCIRPGYGVDTKHFDNILRKTAARSVTRGSAFQWSMVKN
jgi:pseudaminic acid synthase